MANGDIIEYGAIEAITSSGTHDFYSVSTISHEPYDIVRLYPGKTDPQIDWVEYNYNNKKTYIAKSMRIHYISYSESVNVCNNSNSTYTYTIDGINYVLTFMPKEFWTELPSSICTLLNTDTSKKFYTNSPFYTDSTDYYYSVYFNGSDFSYDSESVDKNTIDATYTFVPVLVQDNSFNDENTVQFGRWKLTSDSGDITYLVENSVDYTLYNKIEIDTDYTGNDALSWFVYKIDNKKVYISNEAGINWITLNEAKNFCNKIVEINNEKYTYTLMSVEQWTSIPKTYVNLCFFIPETREILTSSTKTVSIKENAFVENTTTYVEDDKGYGFLYYIPVLTQVTEQVTEDGTVVKMGTWRLLPNNKAEYDQYASYYSKGTCRMDNYKHVQLRDKNSYSGNIVAEMVEYIYNGEKLYIPLFAALSCTNEQANEMVRGCFFDLNDDEVYVGRYMPKDFWINLPSEIMSLVIDGINSDDRIIEDGYLLGIDEYSNTTDKIHKAVAYNKTNNRFEESNSTLSNTQPCCICIPVMGPYTKYEVTRMGILKDSSTGKTYNQKDIISNDTKPYLSYDKITFVDTDNKSEQWKWIKHVYNNEIYYICTSLCSANFGNSDLLNIKEREIVFGNGKFKFCGLSPYKKNPVFLDSEDFLEYDMAYFLKPPGESIRLYGTGTSSGSDHYYFRDIDDYYIGFGSYTTSWPGHGEQTGSYFPILKLLNAAPTISGVDSNLGDKTQAFLIEYTVDDTDSGDTLTVTEKLNGTTIRTINSAVRNQKYSFSVTTSQFANLALYETSTIEIIVSDGNFSATRTYTFRKTNTAPVINYTGSDNLGIINSKPTIRYTVTDAEGDEITITERLNGKVLQTYTVSSGTECTVNIPNISWLGCGNTSSAIEINARDSAGGSSNKTITFTRAIDRIEVITNPIKTDKAVTKISLEVGWNTENASGQVFVCNNAYDASPTWENMTNSVGSNLVYNITNTTKTAAEWGVSVKVIVKKDGGSTGEVSLYSIKGTYE